MTVSAHVGDDGRVICHTYKWTGPILVISAGSASVCISIKGGQEDMPAAAVAFARELAAVRRRVRAAARTTRAGQQPRPRPGTFAGGHRRNALNSGAAGRLHLPAVPGLSLTLASTRRGDHRMRGYVRYGGVTGEPNAQVDNPDPFTPPAWRSPVYRTPEAVIWAVQLARLIWRIAWFVIRHPLLDVAAGIVFLAWVRAGWVGLVALAATIAFILGVLRLSRPKWFTRLVAAPLRDRWRWWFYRRHWHPVLTITGLAPIYRGRVMLPVLGDVVAWPCADRVTVRLVSGQSPKQYADRAEQLAHGFGAHTCRVRASTPGSMVLELVRRDALADPIPALPIPDLQQVDLLALPVGRCEDGRVFTLRLHGTHLLIAGATGAGKGSYLWSLLRAMLPLINAGLVRVQACDPKLMELAYGRAIFDQHGAYAADPGDIAGLLEKAVADMQDRAARFAGRQRDHTPTTEHPFTVVLVDEVAFLTAYQADRKLHDRTLASLATLTTQGRAVGYCVVAALQDPRKEVLNIRNLFPDKIALRLDEPSQADLVLGDGARDRGARCDEISTDPRTGAGVGFIRLEADPDPVRVRAAWVTDTDIQAMTGTTPAWRAASSGEAA